MSHRSCVVVVRGRSRIRYENTGEKYSPIIISAKKTLQTSQTITTATQQTKKLIGVEFPGCYMSSGPVSPKYLVLHQVAGVSSLWFHVAFCRGVCTQILVYV